MTPAMAAMGLGMDLAVARHIEIDLAMSRAMPESHLTNDTVLGSRVVVNSDAPPTVVYETNVGMLWRALVHYHFAETGRGWLLGAGPALVTSGSFGVVPLLHAEAGYEWRPRWGLQVLGAFQFMEPLAVSSEDVDPARCFAPDCPSRFSPRYPVIGWRGALGIVF